MARLQRSVLGVLGASGALLVVRRVLLRDYPKAPETLYHNGCVVTLNEAQPTAEAIVVRDGKIVEVGGSDALRERHPAAVAVDLQGKTVLPGFIDPHSHVDLSAFLDGMVDLSGFRRRTDAEVWDTLRAAVAASAEGAWIAARGLDPLLTPDLRVPTIEDLDRIAPRNPLIILSQTLHNYWANSAAFRAAGITDSTPNPSAGSFYGRDATGRLSGEIVEQAAFSPLRKAYFASIPKSTLPRNFQRTLREYARRGNTTVVTAGLQSDQSLTLRLQRHLSSSTPSLLGQLLARVGLFPRRTPLPRQFVYLPSAMTDLLPDGPQAGDDSFRIPGVKLWFDGSPYAGSAYLAQAYLTSSVTVDDMHLAAGHTGTPLITQEELTEAIRRCNAGGWQVLVHAQGDAAIDQVARSFEAAAETTDLRPQRHRIEHGLLLARCWLPRLHRIGVAPSFHVNHIYYYGTALRDCILGADRAERVLPVASALAAGCVVTLHADQPMFPSEPFSLMQTAVTRQTKEGSCLGADEAITVEQALRALTIDAAWQIRMEDKLGSLEPGKYADLVVVDRNPLATPAQQLRDITVLATIVNGNEVDLSE